MELEKALKVAIGYEHKVRDHYAKSAAKILDPKGRQVFETLAREEQGHVDYLESRLQEWSRLGRVQPAALRSLLPTAEQVKAARKRARSEPASKVADKGEMELLKIALGLEKETSAYYRELVATLPGSDRELFSRFLDIEDGHVALVQAEIDALSGIGTWFDLMEFSLEGG